MLRVCLCDDSVSVLEQYRLSLEKIGEKHGLLMQVKTFDSGESLLFHMEEARERADIIYLDICMGEKNGIETAKKLRDMGCAAELIFLTANPEYVFDSFDVSPMHYIIKGNITDSRFEEIFLKAAILSEKRSEEMFTCSNGAVKRQIPIRDILYFEVANRIITVHYKDEEFSFYMRMEELENELKQKNFIRIHRSYLVHLSCIEEIRKDAVTLISKVVLPLGITYSKNVKTALNQYLSLAQE